MEHKLEWLSGEEGCILFYENDALFLSAEIFVTGEEEAEFRIQDIVSEEKMTKNGDLQGEIISKVTECLSECFRLSESLWQPTLTDRLRTTQAVSLRWQDFRRK